MVGKHILADLHEIALDRLCDATLLAECLSRAAARARLTPVAPPVVHLFAGGGLTGFILLGESHIAFHTYPERRYMALDVFTCGSGDPGAAVEVFREAMGPHREDVTVVDRGLQPP